MLGRNSFTTKFVIATFSRSE